MQRYYGTTHDLVTPMKQVAWEILLWLLDRAKLSNMREHINKMEILHYKILQAREKHLEEDMVIIVLLQLPGKLFHFLHLFDHFQKVDYDHLGQVCSPSS